MRAAHPGWPALEAAVRRKDTTISLAFPFLFMFFPKFRSIQLSRLTSNDGSGMSDPAWLSKLLEEGLKDRSPW